MKKEAKPWQPPIATLLSEDGLPLAVILVPEQKSGEFHTINLKLFSDSTDYNPPQIVQVYGKDALTRLRDALTLALGKIPEGNHESESGED